MTAPAPPLLTAVSPDGKLVAVVPPLPVAGARNSLRVLLYNATTGTLQSTLTYRREGDDDTTSSAIAVLDIRFDAHQVAVLCSHQLVAWDLARGVVSHVVPPPKKHHVWVAMANDVDNQHAWFAMQRDEDNHKLKVCEYDVDAASSWQLTRKIKAGKAAAAADDYVALAVTKHHVVVHVDRTIKILDRTTGSKVTKISHVDAAATTMPCQTVAANHTLLFSKHGKLTLANVTGTESVNTTPTQELSTAGATMPAVIWTDRAGQLHVANDSAILRATTSGNAVVFEHVCNVAVANDLTPGSYRIMGVPHADATLLAVVGHAGQFQVQRHDARRDIVIDWNVAPESNEKDGNEVAAKRKAEAILLGPAQAGATAMVKDATDTDTTTTNNNKRTRQLADDNDGDDDDVAATKTGNDETIGERLRKLQAALDAELDEEEQAERDAATARQQLAQDAGFAPNKRANAESLVHLVSQALQSADDAMLELALEVRDRKVLQTTCAQLSDDHVGVLLQALTARLSSKPQRAEQLCPWLSATLQTGRVRSITQLQPLRNLLQERLENFADLLQLEGRLSMMRAML